jgi:aldehyde:ferredoxin oxidoreductase
MLEKILYVDLFRKKVNLRNLPEEMCGKYIGGKGYGAKILFKELEPKIDAYHPANLLIFATGYTQVSVVWSCKVLRRL